MNKTSHTDEPYEGDDGYNQSPNPLSNDLTTNQDLNGIVNRRALGGRDDPELQNITRVTSQNALAGATTPVGDHDRKHGRALDDGQPSPGNLQNPAIAHSWPSRRPTQPDSDSRQPITLNSIKRAVAKYCSFIGPGFIISVAYIDPGNYSTDIAAGASYRFRLLFIVLLSNLIAIFLQSLAIKLGTVSGLNLAEACRAFLPRWLNFVLYVFAEAAIIATDIAEVIGFAIALNLLIPKVPLVAGCAISILDVMIILLFYRPEGSMKGLRFFELFVVMLVLGVTTCFCIQLSLIHDTSVGKVFQGYLPSHYLIEKTALYQACGILGATVMPHSLYLGSGIVQPRLREYDQRRDLMPPPINAGLDASDNIDKGYYAPSLAAIRHCLKVSVLELSTSLFTFALFVNSAILIVAGASLYNVPGADDANIFGIHQLLSRSISSGAGTLFALALLLSGISAGIVCTIAGQMVSEGALNWKVRPWLRRLVTRSISITPSIIIAGAVGQDGLDAALNGSQVALSIVLPFVSAPLLYFTCRAKYMTVRRGPARWLTEGVEHAENATEVDDEGSMNMANSWYTVIIGVLVWLFIAVMNVANLALIGRD